MIEFPSGEGIRRHDMQRISLDRADESQGHAGAAACIFGDRTIGCETSVRLCRFDHGKRHSVLHAACGIPVLQFQQDAGAVLGNNVAQGQQRGIADAMQNFRCNSFMTPVPYSDTVC
jgi:hypothetical protein